jgi:hypothetical protein
LRLTSKRSGRMIGGESLNGQPHSFNRKYI